MGVASVLCRHDQRLHLAPTDGVSVHTLTLCLERWIGREPPREGCEFCTTCITKWKDSIQSEEHSSETH